MNVFEVYSNPVPLQLIKIPLRKIGLALLLPLNCILALVRHINERYLVSQVAEGDEPAFSQLFHAYHQQLASFVLGWTKSASLTEEIIQDTFLKIWVNRAALSSVERFDNYLYILCRNHTFNALRKIASEKTKRREWLNYFENDQLANSDDHIRDYLPLIEKAVAALPPQQQKVYQLKRVDGLKYEDIAAKMGISPETARKHLAAALKNISSYVKANFNSILLILAATRNQ